MVRWRLLTAVAVLGMVLLAGCLNQGGKNVAPGQQFDLKIGESAAITGENLTLKFQELVEDSRCPTGATCVWAGRVSGILAITLDGVSEKTVLSEPGLTEPPGVQRYRDYEFSFKFEPYPEVGKKIAPADYRLILTVRRL